MAQTHVLNCITGLNVGGAEYMLARFAPKLAGSFFKPSVLSLMRPGPVAQLLASNGIAIASLQMKQSRPGPRALMRLHDVMRSARPGLLHGWMYHGNVAASIGSYLGDRQPVIWSVHHSLANLSSEKLTTRALIRISARLSYQVQAISYCSKVSARQHEALGFDVSKRRIIPNGVDCEQFRPRADARRYLVKQLSLPEERMLIGNIARAHPMKDHANFVRAIARLRSMGLDVQGVLIGDGHNDGVALSLASQLGIGAMITISPARSDIDRLVPGLDLFMLSSAWGEAFPIAVAEAMASGVPAIATDVGDCAWLLGEVELTVEPRDTEGLANLAYSILSLPKEGRARLGEQARGRVISSFSLKSYVDNHLSLYEEIMDQELAGRKTVDSAGPSQGALSAALRMWRRS
ncbi:glycosyltransferase [Sinorhizobium sp. NFACC03]|uniref:glycosyltransferase n=1 Tax=Sinorhizobium sp. NFACC03 TaxID=1566295 RepID=UPI000880E8F6|nr:glycosyltransferase [Sinorhizobium sp. NFACC03]SDA92746.1 Glycosyltransferase involved in cell wall bisynthesis [Sinorhizobium sp. NFACC03]